MPIFEKRGFQMHYEVHRQVVPQTTLMIHGNLANTLWWDPVIERCERNLAGDLIVADWRGNGRSSAPSSVEELAPENLAQDFIDLLDFLQIDKCHLVGHSAGGLISLHCLLADRERFDRALLLAPVAATGLVIDENKRKVFRQLKDHRPLLEFALIGAIRGVESTDPFLQRLVESTQTVADINWLGVLEKFSNFDIRPELKNIENEVLVLFGEQDAVLPINGGREIAELLPNGRFCPVADAGHSLNVEDPARFFCFLQEFLFDFK